MFVCVLCGMLYVKCLCVLCGGCFVSSVLILLSWHFVKLAELFSLNSTKN